MMSKNKQIKHKGFTLLEILLVIGIIGILAAIVIIAINPSRSLARSRDLQRKVGITEINKGLEQYYIDNNQYPSTITSSLQGICNTGASATSTGFNCTDSGLVDLSMLVPTYLPSIPVDPTGVGYKVGFNSSRRIMLVADLTETVSPLIAIGTTTYPVVVVVDSCGVSGDATDPDCWSTATTSLKWGPMSRITNVWDTTDGKANTATLAGLIGIYPAADYCATLTEGGFPVGTWYLPAIDQLTAGLEEYRTQYNLGNTTWGGFQGGFSYIYYWSSTEYIDDEDGSADLALGADYGSNVDVVSTDFGPKNYTGYRTRCLR
jgi:prepilin-type N-terminal cleavage/methylation domain-containing protein